MGKLRKKKSKSNEKVNSNKPVSKKCMVSHRGTSFPSTNTVEDNQPLTAIHTTAEIVKEDVRMSDKTFKSILNTSIDDNEHGNFQTASNATVPNIADASIIDITDDIDDNNYENSKTISLKSAIPNIADVSIIDITDDIDDNEHKNSKTISSKTAVPKIESDNIIVIDITMDTTISNDNTHTTGDKKKPIAYITLDDDDDDGNDNNNNNVGDDNKINKHNDKASTLCQRSIDISSSSRSIRERPGIVSKSKAIKRSHNNPLRHNNKKMLKKKILKHRSLPRNNNMFAVNEQFSTYFGNQNPEAINISQQLKSLLDIIPYINRSLRPIIIDGLNIGHAHGCGTFSAKGIQLCIQYFANRGHQHIVAFIPQHRRGFPGSESNRILTELVQQGHICYTPSRVVQNMRMTCYEDRILLNYAYEFNGVVISNDNFRDLYNESDAIREIIENRLVMVTFFRDIIIVPEDQYNGRNHFRSLSNILCFP